LKKCENKVPRRIFKPKKEEVTGGWRKLHNYELHNLHSLSDIVRMTEPGRMKWADHVTCMKR